MEEIREVKKSKVDFEGTGQQIPARASRRLCRGFYTTITLPPQTPFGQAEGVRTCFITFFGSSLF
jgi:hypothetical protein